MLKLVALLSLITAVHAAGFGCPATKITYATPTGNLPTGATTTTLIPAGTNCTFNFDIPNGYALLVQLSADFQSDKDTVIVVDNTNKAMHLSHTGKPVNSVPAWFAATTAQVQVVGVSGNSKFMASYQYQSLGDYKQTKKNTGEYFPLSQITGKVFYTIYSANKDKVVATYGKETSQTTDVALSQIFVYDGEDIRTAKMIGSLDVIGSSTIISSSGNALSLVNFYNAISTSYVLGNDASALSGIGKYSVIMSKTGSAKRGSLGDLTGRTAAYTFICIDCNNFYLTQWAFDSTATISNMGTTTFQGQTPTHKKEKLIKYDAMTLTSNQFPQLFPTNILTVGVYLSKINFYIHNANGDSDWRRPYEGRKGYIFSPNLWMSNNPVSFNYDFRNNSQQFNYNLNIDKMSFGLSSDSMTLNIGPVSGNPSVSNQYPRDQSATGKVSSNGNYMQIALTGSQSDDVRLSFEIKKTSSSATIGILSSVLFALYAAL